MGTTAEKLQNILNAKEAIRTKFNLPEDLPFAQYADNITAGGGTVTSTAEYFKCVAVGEKVEEGGSGGSVSSGNSTDIVVSGIDSSGIEYFTELNQEYYQYNADATGNTRIWISKNTFYAGNGGTCYGKIYKYDGSGDWRLVIVNEPGANSYHGRVALLSGSNADPIGTWNDWDDYNGNPAVTEWASGGSSSELPEPVFHAPLAEQKNTAETGQALTYNGNVQFTEIDGKKCAYFDGSSYIQFSDAEFPAGGNERTIACWVKQTSADTGYQHVFGYGGDGSYKKFYICVNPDGYISFTQYGSDFGTGVSPDVWKFVVITHKNGQQKIFVDGGVESAGGGLTVSTTLAIGRIGASQNVASDEFFKGYVADAILYDVAFSPEQIEQLYQKMLPTSDPLPANTWNGQKALLLTDEETGKPYYDFEETVTEGLIFGNGFTPVRGGIYDREALVKVTLFENLKIPQEGLVLKADLTSGLESTVELSGLPEFKEINGRQCAYMNGTTCVRNDSFNVGNQFTVSFAVCGNPFKQGDPLLGIGAWKNYSCLEILMNYNDQYPAIYLKSGYSDDPEECGTNIATGWHHLILTWDGQFAKLYIDNALSGTHSWDDFTFGNGIALGANYDAYGQVSRHSYTTAGYQLWRVYNRVLTDDERTLLYQEFAK